MSRPSGNFQQAIGFYFSRWYGGGGAYTGVMHDVNNNTSLTWASADDATSIPVVKADADSRIQVDLAALMGDRNSEQFYFNAAGGLVTQSFFVAPRAMTITGIDEIHSTAETATGTSTLVVTHDLAGVAAGAGTVVMTNTFNLKGTANTTQSAALLAVTAIGTSNASIIMAAGDRLSIKTGGTATITAEAGVVLTVHSSPGFKELTYQYNMQANGSIATQSFGLANRDMVVTGVWMSWGTAATNGSAVTADVTIESSTTAAGSGTSCLAAAQSVKGTANTPVFVPLSATAANLLMRAGYRLSVKMTGTLTALAGLVITVTTGPVGALAYIGENQATFTLLANAGQGTQGFFLADRDYEVIDFSAIWGTAGTDGGTVTYDCTIDKGAVAPGAGTSCLAAATSAKTTANTVSVPGVSTSRRNRLMSKGDLLSFKTAGTLTALAGVTATATLAPR